MDAPLARRSRSEALEVAVGENGALGGGHGWPRKKDVVARGYMGATLGLCQPMFYDIARCAQKTIAYGHLARKIAACCYTPFLRPTSISMTSCMGRSSANENASLAPSCRVSSNRLLSDVAASWMMLFSVSAASCARRPALPDQAIAVVEKEGLDLGLDLAQRGDDVLRLFASHEDGLGLDDVGIVADELGVLPQFDE